jgi:hypothetical protein
MQKNHDELHMIAIKEFSHNDEMYKVVDFLNKSLKSKGLIFGMTYNADKDVITIYDVEQSRK